MYRKLLLLVLAPVIALGQGSQLPKYTVATLPAANTLPSYTVQVIDGLNDQDCVTGGGTKNVLCKSRAGSWFPVAPFQSLTTTGTSGAATLNLGVLNIPNYAGGSLAVATTDCLTVNGGNGPISSGTATFSGVNCGRSITPLVNVPVAGQYVILHPTTVTVSDNNPRTVTTAKASNISFGGTSASARITLDVQGTGFPPALGTATFSGFSLPAGISAGSVTAVYGFTVASSNPFQTGTVDCNSFQIPLSPIQQSSTLSIPGLTGSGISSATCTVTINDSGSSPYGGYLTASDVGLIVYYTGTPVTSPNYLNIGPDLVYDSTTNTLQTDQFFPQRLNAIPISQLPGAGGTAVLVTYLVSDYNSSTPGACGAGGGTTVAFANSSPSAWQCYPLSAIGGGGGSGISGQTVNYYVKATSATGSTTSGIIEDQGTGIVVHGTGAGTVQLPEGTPVSGSAGVDVITADSTSHQPLKNPNNTGALALVGTSTTPATAGHCKQYAANGIDDADAGAACGSGSSTPLISRVSCVTYGCVADGNVTANTGTDNTTPFTNCLAAAVTAKGVCYVPAGVYRIATSLPTVNTSSTGFVGDVWGAAGGTTWTGPSTTIFSSSSSATILTVSSGSTSYITGNYVQNLALQRGVTAAAGSIALLLDHAAAAVINRNVLADSATGIDITNAPAYGVGLISNNSAEWGYSGISCPAYPLKGFALHGGGTGFISMRMERNTVSNNGCTTGTSYGFFADGNLIDLMMDHNETAGPSYGVYFVGTVGQDVHILNQIDDGNITQCEHFDYAGSGVASELRGGWCETTHPTGGGTELHNVRGFTVSERQYYDSGGTLPEGVIVNTGSSANAVINNTFYQFNSVGIVCNGASGNNFSNNTFNMGGAASEAIDLVNCSKNTIMANKAFNGSSTIMKADVNSNNNVYLNLNQWDSSGTAISDAGTNNQLVSSGATANALTMNNSGTGAASGSTFDGSAAKTISYNTIGAQQALTLTTTGTSGAATLSAGTLNIPQYAVSGSGNYTNITSSLTPTNCTISSGSCATTGSVSSITLASIPGTYKHLRILYAGVGSAIAALNCQYNGDTGANYAHEYMQLNNSTVTGNPGFNGTSNACGTVGTLNGQGYIEMNYYSSTTLTKGITWATSAFSSVSSASSNYFTTGTAFWNNSGSAVTSINLAPSTGTFSSGFSVTVYGEN